METGNKRELPGRQVPLLRLSAPQILVGDAVNAGDQIAQRLQSLSDAIGSSHIQNQFYKKIRVKAEASIVGKVRRKVLGTDRDKPRPLYSFRDLTDIVGFRIVTLYDSDLGRAIDQIVDIVTAGQKLSNPLFVGATPWVSFHQAHFYTRALGNDVYSECQTKLKGLIATDCKGRPGRQAVSTKPIFERIEAYTPKEGEERYSSAHLIFDAISYGKSWDLVIPVEFQLRTTLEDVWAEINHQLLYKIKSPFVWNKSFENNYNIAKTASDSLKASMMTLPATVENFYYQSTAAQAEISHFANPEVPNHHSLCLALFYNLGDQHSGSFINDFDNYKKLLLRLRSKPEASKAKATLFLRAIETIDRVRGGQMDVFDFREPRDTDNLVAQQRAYLCELEKIRLEILILLLCNFQIEKDELIYLPRNNQLFKERCIKLYAGLCDYRAQRELLVRPTAMLLYWKYTLAREFDTALASKTIRSAYEEMTIDGSLPWYSIYRVLIPRHLAKTILWEVGSIVASFPKNSPRPKVIHGLASDLRARLIQAMGYALEAFRVSKEPHEDRGDIVYGFEETDWIKDPDTVLSIYSNFHKIFDSLITESIQVDRKEIGEVVAYLDRKLRRAPIKLSKSARSKMTRVKADLIRVKKLLKTDVTNSTKGS